MSAFASAHMGAARQTPGVQRVSKDWKQARAGDIEVMGPVSDGDIRNALEQIRGFRELFAGLLPNLKVTSANPTRVVVFPNSSALRRFAPRDTRGRLQNLGGYFASTADVNIIAIGGSDRELIYHEFAHYLLRHNLHSQPMWVNEGLAEFYSTFEVDDKKGTVVVGRPPPEPPAHPADGSITCPSRRSSTRLPTRCPVCGGVPRVSRCSMPSPGDSCTISSLDASQRPLGPSVGSSRRSRMEGHRRRHFRRSSVSTSNDWTPSSKAI